LLGGGVAVTEAAAQAGLVIEFLHEFPFAVEKQLPFLIPVDDRDPHDNRPGLWTLESR
jgi:hypothetical protein